MIGGATPQIDSELARRLIDAQFPEYSRLSIHPVLPGGWDNRTFRLGDDLAIRLPSAERYAPQVNKEHRWLPILRPLLSLPIPDSLALGSPEPYFPRPWSVRRWIDGHCLAGINGSVIPRSVDSRVAKGPVPMGAKAEENLAHSLANFLQELHAAPSSEGPTPGPHNFYRGGSLQNYDAEVRSSLNAAESENSGREIIKVWEAALDSKWSEPPVWIHGDIAPGNLLVDDEARLSAVIDFGSCGVGDPACDLTMAWTFFREPSRRIFRASLKSLAPDVWLRAKGWALWKALITAADDSSTETQQDGARRVIDEVLRDT